MKLLLALFLDFNLFQADKLSGRVVGVSDSDTITLLYNTSRYFKIEIDAYFSFREFLVNGAELMPIPTIAPFSIP